MEGKKYLLFVLIAIFPLKLISQTNIGGTLVGNSIWTMDKSPYNITSDIGIVPGDTLMIEPGVRINGGSMKIIVKGTVIVIGDQDNLVELNSVKIYFESTELNGSRFLYVIFNGSGIQLADEEPGNLDNIKVTGQLDIKKCQFINNSYLTEKGYETTTTILIDSSTFNKASINDKMYGHNYIDVKNCKIFNCMINMENYNFGAFFENCDIKGTNILISGTKEFRIANSRITNSSIRPISDYQNIKIDSSVILNTPIRMTTAASNWQNYNLTIINSVIKGSVAELINYRTTNINNSTIINENGIVLNLVEGVNIDKSLIIGGKNDDKGIIVVNSLNLFVKNTNSNISNSNFLNCKSYFIKNEVDGNFAAQNNYWGTIISDTISKRIFDVYDNINFGKVDFANFLLNPDTTAPISPPGNVIKGIKENKVVVSWNSNSESDLAGYRIFYNPIDEFTYDNFIDAGIDTSCTIEGIGLTDTIVVIAIDKSSDGINDLFEGHISWYSSPAQDTSNQIFVNIISSSINQDLIVYPNPISNRLYIKYPNNISINEFTIYSVDGKLIKQGEGDLLKSGVQTTELRSGVYFLKVNYDNKTKVTKFIKQ